VALRGVRGVVMAVMDYFGLRFGVETICGRSYKGGGWCLLGVEVGHFVVFVMLWVMSWRLTWIHFRHC
jgi:hypothetical protein